MPAARCYPGAMQRTRAGVVGFIGTCFDDTHPSPTLKQVEAWCLVVYLVVALACAALELVF